MAIKIEMAFVQLAGLLTFVCGVAFAGELIVVPLGSGEASASPSPGQVNREAGIDNEARARMYGDPNRGTVPNIIIIAPEGSAAEAAAEKNREAMIRNRLRAKAQSQGKDGNRSGNNTLVILPGTPPGGLDSQRPLDTAMDRARSWSDGDGGRRPCTSATVSLGTVGNVVVVDRSGDPTSNAQGVNTIAVGGGGCR